MSTGRGRPEDFFKLHDVAIAAVRRALPTARVGGPDVAGAGGEFMDGFLQHVIGRDQLRDRRRSARPPTSSRFMPRASRAFVDGHVRMGISTHLKEVDDGFQKIAAVPALAAKPIVIGESDPEGCAACPGPQNAYRNGTMYSSYTAASFARIWELARQRHVNLEGVLSWAFEFENQPWFAGYRQLATNGVNLPVLNVFRLFARLGPERVAADSSAAGAARADPAEGVRGETDVGTLATRPPNGSVAVLIWNYHDDDLPGAGRGGAPYSHRSQIERRECGHDLARRRVQRQRVCRLAEDGRAAVTGRRAIPGSSNRLPNSRRSLCSRSASDLPRGVSRWRFRGKVSR